MAGYAVRTVFLVTLITGLAGAIAYWLAGLWGVVIVGAIMMAINIGSYWFSDRIIRSSMGAKEVSEREAPQLHRIVERAALEAKLPKPKVYIVETPMPNAFATGRSPNHAAVAATTGIMSLLSERELQGVFAHELAHVKNRDTLWSCIVAMMAGIIMLIAMVARFGLMFAFLFGGMGRDSQGGGSDIGHLAGALVLAFVAPIIAALIQSAVSRQREFAADEMGARNGRDPQALASALMKLEQMKAHPDVKYATEEMSTAESANHLFIVNPLSGGVGKWFSSHPPTEERVERLRKVGRDIGQIF